MTAKDERICMRFNETYKVGTPVLYWPVLPKRSGMEPVSTRTRSEAMLVSSGPVIFLEDKSGYVALSHVEPIP